MPDSDSRPALSSTLHRHVRRTPFSVLPLCRCHCDAVCRSVALPPCHSVAWSFTCYLLGPSCALSQLLCVVRRVHHGPLLCALCYSACVITCIQNIETFSVTACALGR